MCHVWRRNARTRREHPEYPGALSYRRPADNSYLSEPVFLRRGAGTGTECRPPRIGGKGGGFFRIFSAARIDPIEESGRFSSSIRYIYVCISYGRICKGRFEGRERLNGVCSIGDRCAPRCPLVSSADSCARQV